MLRDYQPSILDEMDRHDITRQCWQCAHFQSWNSGRDRCSSPEMLQAVRDLTGVRFVNLILPVEQKTDASLCSEFCLSHDEAVRLEIMEMLDDARIQAKHHAAHYNHLRRTDHV